MFLDKKWRIARKARKQAAIFDAAIGIAKPVIEKMKAQLGFGYFGGTTAGGSKWPGGIAGSGGSIYLDHYRTRQNARVAYFDSSQAKAVVDRFADTVADVGLRLEATPVADILGISQETAEKWAKAVEQQFDLWSGDKKQNRSEQLTFYQTHHLYQLLQHRDGEVFARLYYAPDSNLQNPLQFEFLDPNQISGSAITTSQNVGRYGFDGIERDNRGREERYTVWVIDPSKPQAFQQVKLPRKSTAGRIMMIHGFKPYYPGQGRGYSELAHALQEFQKLTDFTEANIMKAIAQSCFSLYVKPSKKDDASGPLDDLITDSPAGPAALQVGVNPTPPADAEDGPPVTFSQAPPEATLNMPGGAMIANLKRGEDLRTLDNTAPVESYANFVEAFTAHLAASVSMPVEVLLMKFGTNYSASRAALVLFWRVARIWRDEMAADYLNVIYEMWMAGEIAAGRIEAPGWSDPRLRAAWLSNRWIGSPMPNIDPKRTAEADRAYIEMGVDTLGSLARNHNGSDAARNRASLVREFAELPTAPWNKPESNPEKPDEEDND